MMEAEIVRRRAWIAGDEFLDLLGVTNLIPGPNSTEMAMALGYRRAGWRGLVAGGTAFIVPAALITVTLAWAYVRYGTRPDVQPWLAGLAPSVTGVIAAAAVLLARPLIRDGRRIALAIIALAAALLGVDAIVVLVGSGLLGWLSARPAPAAIVIAMLGVAAATASTGPVESARAPLLDLGWFFLRTGSILYGGGYVLAALLQPLVEPLGWMSRRELLDALAAGQATPGPVFTTATFVGFVIHGWSGAATATLAIFLPAFVGVAILMQVLERLRAWTPARRFLDGVTAGAWAVVAATAVMLARDGLSSPVSLLIAAASCAASLAGANAAIVVVLGLAAGVAWRAAGL
jgi:chromate transporter